MLWKICCSNVKMTLLKWLLPLSRQSWKKIDQFLCVLFAQWTFLCLLWKLSAVLLSVCDCHLDPCSSLYLCSKTVPSRSLCHDHALTATDTSHDLQICIPISFTALSIMLAGAPPQLLTYSQLNIMQCIFCSSLVFTL
jgi:hypothetical protein